MSLRNPQNPKTHRAVIAWQTKRHNLQSPELWSPKLSAKVLLMRAKQMELVAADYSSNSRLKIALLTAAGQTKALARGAFRSCCAASDAG